MSRRKLLLVGVIGAFASALALYLALTPRATVENYHQIQDGMVLSDVETLLGAPICGRVHAFTYLDLCTNAGTLREEFAAVKATDEAFQWQDRGGAILVGFRPGGTVIFKRYDPPQSELPLDKFRRWLGSVKLGW